MKSSLDLAALRAFVDAEFRHQFRAVVDAITQPIARRVDAFTCWPGLEVIDVDPEGRRARLRFRRNPSKLRVGEHVYVNSLDTPPEAVISGAEGIITAIDATTGEIKIEAGYQQTQRFAKAIRRDGLIVLDQTLPGARFSRDMPILALRILDGEFGRHPRLTRLRELMEGERRAAPTNDRPLDRDDPFLAMATKNQWEAIRRGVEEDFALIQGPPGTGKTWVLGLLIREFVRRGLKVAVCAFTHQAINNVLFECLKHPDIPSVAKVGSIGTWSGTQEDSRLKLVARPAAFFRQKTTPAVAGFTQHAAFNPVSRALDEGLDDALPNRFDVVIFDEAGQLTLPAALMAMLQADRFVLAGDQKQLPPVVATHRPGFGPATSIFRRFVEDAKHESVLLDTSFRLNAELAAFPSEAFYEGRVQSSEQARDRRLTIKPDGPRAALLDPERPSSLALVRHTGRGQESPEEAALVAHLLDDAIRAGMDPKDIAIICPHRRQNVRIREFAAALGHQGLHPLIDTVERIQGQERELIILSMALSDPEVISGESEFLFLPNRLNVALTRARSKLVFVASPEVFRALPPHHAFGALGPSPLENLNVLKRWYFRHKGAAIDATELAREALKALMIDDAPKDHETAR